MTDGCQIEGAARDSIYVSRPRLFLNYDADYDWFIALEFGRVDDGQPSNCWRRVCDELGFLHDGPGGHTLGFKLVGFSEFDVGADEVAEIWGDPRFDVPVLGLGNVSAGEVITAARPFFGGHSSINRQLFNSAIAAAGEPEDAVDRWLACLMSGDAMAHFALGYTLYGLGRHHEAYRHSRHYTEIAPHCTWAWCWYGYACEALGELAEARSAYRRALELEAAGEDETDAEERLSALDA